MIYTSYYGNLKFIEKTFTGKTTAMSISVSDPTKLLSNVKQLTPDWDNVQRLKNRSISQTEFVHRYMRKLKIVSNQYWDIVRLFIDNPDDNLVLVCYERPELFCHRHLLRVFMDSIGIPVEEAPTNTPHEVWDPMVTYNDILPPYLLRD